MAFIVCPNCKKTISDKALSCPHCATPTSEFQATKRTQNAPTPPPAPKKKTSTRANGASGRRSVSAAANPIDQSASNATKRFSIHTLVAIIGFGVAYLIGGLCVDLLEDALSLNLSTVSAVTLFMTVAAVIVAIVIGFAGPIAPYDFLPEEKHKIVCARPKPLHLCCIAYYVLAIVCAVLYFIFRKEYSAELEGLASEKAILSLALSVAGAVYFGVLGLCSNLHILGATCRECGRVSCRIKIGESSHTTKTSTETRERTYGGASYDLYDSSGAHVGTATGPDTTVTESRTVSTESWNNDFVCHFCKHRSQSRESNTTRERWHR